MNCLCCFQCQKSSKSFANREHDPASLELLDPETKNARDGTDQVAMDSIAAQAFTFRELATATRNFRRECLLGEGGFGKVFKGTLASNGQVVAIKQLDRSGTHGNKEFLGEVLKLSLLHHPNLVNLIGYCADGDQRILVYEYMPAGSLQNHLLDIPPDQKPLGWFTRMRVAFGAAKGLEYLHDQDNSPIIYRELKPSNILLDEENNPKLSDFGLAKLGPSCDSMYVPSRVMGTYGYCAPEYARSGELTLKSDVYCFGVILLELITGRRALDTTRPMDEQNLVAWAQPIFKDPKRFPDMADPILNKRFPEKDLNQAVAIAAMCLQEESAARPLMSDVVTALSFLSVGTEESLPSPLPLSTPPLEENAINNDDQQDADAGDSSGNDDEDSSGIDDNESEDHQNEDTEEEEHDLSASDGQDHDKSDCEEGDSVVPEGEESEDEHQQTDGESNRWSKSSMKSIYESVSGSQKSNKSLGHRHVSRRHKGSSVTDDGSVSSGDDSRRSSGEETALLSHKSSKNSQSGPNNILSAKSSKNSRNGILSYASSKNSLFSLSHKSSRGSTEGGDSASHLGSRRSQNESGSFSRSISGGETESNVSSPGSGSKSQNGNTSFDDKTSRGGSLENDPRSQSGSTA